MYSSLNNVPCKQAQDMYICLYVVPIYYIIWCIQKRLKIPITKSRAENPTNNKIIYLLQCSRNVPKSCFRMIHLQCKYGRLCIRLYEALRPISGKMLPWQKTFFFKIGSNKTLKLYFLNFINIWTVNKLQFEVHLNFNHFQYLK